MPASRRPNTARRTASYIRSDVESAPRVDIERLQLEGLRTGIDRLRTHVPLYGNRLGPVGVTGSGMASLGDLAALPLTTKDDLRDHYPYGLVAVPMEEVVRFHASSGTTGKPTVVAYTRNDIVLWSELVARALAAAGVTARDIIHNAYGYGLFTGGLGLHYGGELIGAKVIPLSGGQTKRQIMILQDFGSTVLCCTPSYALLIAEVLDDEGIDPHALSLEVGLFGAEPWSEAMRREIETRLGILALDIYGLSEIIGPGVAVECPEQAGLHVFEDHFIREIIDPETGDPLPDGELGELVITCVTKEALPLLRYRTRDRTRLTREPCACGRTTARMERVLGRTDDMLIIRGVNVFPSQIEAALLAAGEVEPHYQIFVDRGRDHLDTMEVLVEASPTAHEGGHSSTELERRLNTHVANTLGISCTVKLVAHREIPRSEGKAVRVVDRRSL